MPTTEEIRENVLSYVKKAFLEDEEDELTCDTPSISGGIVD